MVLLLRNEPGMEAANQMVNFPQILGVVGHGIGHGAIARTLRAGEDTPEDLSKSEWESGELFRLSPESVPYLFFWFLLLKSTMPKQSASTLAVLSMVSLLGQQFFPRNFGFTYVQSVLFIAFASNQIMMKPKQDKGFEYGLYPWIVGLPVGFIAVSYTHLTLPTICSV